MRILIQTIIFLLAIGAWLPGALAKDPPREILGLRLGMREEAVRERLRKVANQQKEEREESEGEQEVWILPRHKKFDYLLVRFDSKHQLWFMTVVTRRSANLRYSDVADIKQAKQANDGRNYSFTWKIAGKDKRPGQIVIARGSDPNLLTSYSIYRAKS
jgi:hypothetical protein